MQIGLSSASFYPNIKTEESIQLMKSIGFNTGEIFLNTESEYEDKFIYKLLKEREKYNFNINSIHCVSSMFEPYLFDDYERRRRDVMKVFERVCIAARKLQTKLYTFHGPRYIGENINMERIINIYKELIYIAGENDVYICQENVSWCQSRELDFLRILKKEVPNLKYTLDLKQAFKANINPVEYINIMGEDLKNFHINDKDDKNPCLLPTKGNINYIQIFKELQKINYKGKAIIEVYRENFSSYNELTECKNNLKKRLEELI